MARDAGDALYVQDALSGDTLPLGDCPVRNLEVAGDGDPKAAPLAECILEVEHSSLIAPLTMRRNDFVSYAVWQRLWPPRKM